MCGSAHCLILKRTDSHSFLASYFGKPFSPSDSEECHLLISIRLGFVAIPEQSSQLTLVLAADL
jgi:hypothetical protein